MRQITTGKAPGVDNIPPETRKKRQSNKKKVKLSHPCFADIWDKEDIPNNWQEAAKGNDSSKCDSWKVITFLCILSKLMIRVI